MIYPSKQIESKWQKKWEQEKVFQTKKNSKKKKFYVLEMFPYPSALGLHMGHALNYTIGDIYARFKRMRGFHVLYPMGFDALGLPAENAAIKAGTHPKSYTKKAIDNYIKQMKDLGLSYDWSKLVSTLEPEYYKWNQLFFLKFLEKGLAYRKKSAVNWCPKCNTVLANEQVHNGRCWRHEDTEVEIKHLEQWYLKTTAYAEELLEKIDSLQWPESIKLMQKNWIGKSHGTEIIFSINGKKWPIFTTRPDTIYGVTFMVISAQHPNLMDIVTAEQKTAVNKFIKKIKSVSEKELEDLEKEGVFTGSYAINPINDEKIPVYAGNFVLADYGSGMVMAVPAHDQRDFEFAKKYKIPIKVVIQPELYNLNVSKMPRAYTGQGKLINSEKFNGLENKEAISEITKYLSGKKLAKKTTQFKMRDWLISRQRYWGTPIPIIYCEKCGIVNVPEKDLPVKLPEKVKFGKGNPLETAKQWISVKCPKCFSEAQRETDTMDTFVDSSWYYMRYPDPKNKKQPFDKKIGDYWLPVDQYIGGVEHATMHLLYARFWTKALRDLGYVDYDEPFTCLFNQGMLHGEEGNKMSKSIGNVILPETVSKKYGIDTARFFLMSLASPEKARNWDSKGIEGSLKLIKRIIKIYKNVKIGKTSPKIESKLNKAIKDITEEINNFKYNLAIIKIRNLFDSIPTETSKDVLEKSLKLLHPFCPHITEELWEKLGNKPFLTLQKWPKYDEKKINPEFEKQDQLISKLKSDIEQIKKLTGKNKAKIYVYVLPNEFSIYNEFPDIKLFKVNDKNKYDPEKKSKKVKPGKPGIYLE